MVFLSVATAIESKFEDFMVMDEVRNKTFCIFAGINTKWQPKQFLLNRTL